MAAEGRAHKLVQLRRAEKRPPLGGDLCPHLEALRLASAHWGRLGPFGLRCSSVEADCGTLRRAIVRTDRATRRKSGGRDRHASAKQGVHRFSLVRLPACFGPRPTTRARTASRNWRCALAFPPEPPWKKWSRKAVLKLTASIRSATVSGTAAESTRPSCCSARR